MTASRCRLASEGSISAKSSHAATIGSTTSQISAAAVVARPMSAATVVTSKRTGLHQHARRGVADHLDVPGDHRDRAGVRCAAVRRVVQHALDDLRDQRVAHRFDDVAEPREHLPLAERAHHRERREREQPEHAGQRISRGEALVDGRADEPATEERRDAFEHRPAEQDQDAAPVSGQRGEVETHHSPPVNTAR